VGQKKNNEKSTKIYKKCVDFVFFQSNFVFPSQVNGCRSGEPALNKYNQNIEIEEKRFYPSFFLFFCV
jgi:hypothetical protein